MARRSSLPLLDAYASIRCEVRLQHLLDDEIVLEVQRDTTGAEQRRMDAGRHHEDEVLAALAAQHGDSFVLINQSLGRQLAQEATQAALDARVPLIAQAWLPADEEGRRRGRADLLVWTGAGYLPVEVKLHLLTTEGGKGINSSPLSAPYPAHRTLLEGLRFRKGTAWFNDALQLAHYYRMLQSLGLAAEEEAFLGGVIDGSGRLLWIDHDLVGGKARRTPLAEYDLRFGERLALADATQARNDDRTLPRPLDPWWHKECENCPFSDLCEGELEERDDVSLVRWSNAEDLAVMRSAGVQTRADLAKLDLQLVDLGESLSTLSLSLPGVLELAREAAPEAALDEVVGRRMGVRRHLELAGLETVNDLLGRDLPSLTLAGRVRDLGRLVRRARALQAGGVVLQIPAEDIDAARADVEIDVDMESYEHATYLWGAWVTCRTPVPGIEEGYRAFVTFEDLSEDAEAAIFADFWSWLSALRAQVRAAGLSFRAYCFWRSAEETQMRRAAAIGGERIPTQRELERFFSSGDWVDLHELVKNQLLTEGPLGLKVLATRAGFSWRDEDPSGEASIGWYEAAVGDDAEHAESNRRRLLAYNEDDVLATRALRIWLDTDARRLPQLEAYDQ